MLYPVLVRPDDGAGSSEAVRLAEPEPIADLSLAEARASLGEFGDGEQALV